MGVFELDHATASSIIKKFGSPVYVYSEEILRKCCRDLMEAFNGRLSPSYSIKANSNLSILKIVREEGLKADAMSPGEIYLLEKAGFDHSEMFYISNNVSAEEMRFAIDRGILTSVDSLSQLETYGKINRGGRVAIRFNPGLGVGHCDKVITGGHKTKFGVQEEFWPQVKDIVKAYDLQLVGINHHIGSLFLEPSQYVKAAKNLLDFAAEHFPGLDFIDFGGGFGVPYKPEENRLDYKDFTDQLFAVFDEFLEKYDNKDVHFKCEPGRYVVCECGAILGTVHSIKENFQHKYVGTDIGFNVLMRPVMYDSYHEVKVISEGSSSCCCSHDDEPATVVGNICESGDILAKDRKIGHVELGDIIEVMNAGAYGYSMASNYNCRLRPAEVMIKLDGSVELIRKADTYETLVEGF